MIPFPCSNIPTNSNINYKFFKYFNKQLQCQTQWEGITNSVEFVIADNNVPHRFSNIIMILIATNFFLFFFFRLLQPFHKWLQSLHKGLPVYIHNDKDPYVERNTSNIWITTANSTAYDTKDRNTTVIFSCQTKEGNIAKGAEGNFV